MVMKMLDTVLSHRYHYDDDVGHDYDPNHSSESKGLSAVIVGAGKRADVYSEYARKNPELLKVEILIVGHGSHRPLCHKCQFGNGKARNKK